jgi:hypothetical protein
MTMNEVVLPLISKLLLAWEHPVGAIAPSSKGLTPRLLTVRFLKGFSATLLSILLELCIISIFKNPCKSTKNLAYAQTKQKKR